jgi:hypothetical protein
MKFTVSAHAHEEMRRRGIPLDFVRHVVEGPSQILPERGGKVAYQSKLDFEDGKMYLVGVIVDDSVDPAVVVTVYRTSKISKYWREP